MNCNPLYTPRELEHQLNDSGAQAIVILENFAAVLARVVEKTKIEHVIVTQIADMLDLPQRMIVNFMVKSIKRMVRRGVSRPQSVPISLAAGQRSSVETAPDRAGRYRFPTIYWRDNRRAEGRDAQSW